jgi:hypothetical protein
MLQMYITYFFYTKLFKENICRSPKNMMIWCIYVIQLHIFFILNCIESAHYTISKKNYTFEKKI